MEKNNGKATSMCILMTKYEINYPNFDEDVVTVNQDREVCRLKDMEPVIRTFDVESIDLHTQVMAICKSAFEAYDSIAHLLRIRISWPCHGAEIAKSELPELSFWSTVVYDHEDIKNWYKETYGGYNGEK